MQRDEAQHDPIIETSPLDTSVDNNSVKPMSSESQPRKSSWWLWTANKTDEANVVPSPENNHLNEQISNDNNDNNNNNNDISKRSTALNTHPDTIEGASLETVAQDINDSQNKITKNTDEPVVSDAVEPIATTAETAVEWLQYLNPYTPVSNAVNYVYTNVNVPISSKAIKEGESVIKTSWDITQVGWIPWWTQKQEILIKPSSKNDELYQECKTKIETNIENGLSYALKLDDNITSDNLGELAVFGTSTLDEPVRIRTLPKCPNEQQEAQLNKPTSREYSLVPEFRATYREITRRTKTRLFSENLLLNRMNNQRHLYRLNPKDVKYPKNVLIIGIHSFYPFKFVKAFLNEPTDNGLIITQKATETVKQWGQENNLELNIQSIVLDGYGNLNERVSHAIALLQNWITLVESCDYLYIVGHSSSTPVAIHLLARLIQLNLINDIQNISLLSLNGNCLGFRNLNDVGNGSSAASAKNPNHTSSINRLVLNNGESSLLNELLELNNPESYQSLRLMESLNTILKINKIKVTFAGNINDQMVPLYSSVCLNLTHPNIFRSLLVNDDNSLFVKDLFNLLMILKNLGYSDHNLLQELSRYFNNNNPTSPTNLNHTSILGDLDVYKLAIENSLLTTNLFTAFKLIIRPISPNDLSVNPYHLPWCIRGIFNDLKNSKGKFKTIDMKALVSELITDFKDWNPSLKWLKDLKYYLDAVAYLDAGEVVN